MARSKTNVPTELLRTLITVSETGSLSKAAQHLDLSQPAISSQMKRMQVMLGDTLFHKTANGSVPTELGALVIERARRMLDANDDILRLSGKTGDKDHVRLGLSSPLIDLVTRERDTLSSNNLSVVSDNCTAIARAFSERALDVAMVLDAKDHRAKLSGNVVAEFDIDFAWMRMPEFVVSPGQPIPIAMWPADQAALNALSAAGRAYRAMFASPDYFSKFAAVRSGKCVAVVPRKAIVAPFVEAKEYYLPAIEAARVLLAVHGNPESLRLKPLISRLSAMNFVGFRN